MSHTGMDTSVEPAASSEKDAPAGEGEPSRTCSTDVLMEDERWAAVAGLDALIPDLAAEALRAGPAAGRPLSVSVALLSDVQVQALNKGFRGKDAPTNVLSFPAAPALYARADADEPLFLGDVALAYETVVGEASSQGKTVLQHAAHLVVHGILHLAGFDHDGDADAERMEKAERAILARFGIPDPYGEDAATLATAS